MENLSGEGIESRLEQLEGWTVSGGRLQKEYKFSDFGEALNLKFVNKAGRVAGSINHHPRIRLEYGKVKLEIWTHGTDGITERDFDFASKVDA